MAEAVNIRFLNNFVLTVVTTGINDAGDIVAEEHQFHVKQGDIYPISQYERHPDGKVDIQFPDTCDLAGMANRIEGDYCEIVDPPASRPLTISSGCGGCQNKK